MTDRPVTEGVEAIMGVQADPPTETVQLRMVPDAQGDVVLTTEDGTEHRARLLDATMDIDTRPRVSEADLDALRQAAANGTVCVVELVPADDMQRERARADHLLLQAQVWALEARALEATVHDLYTLLGCGTIKPRPVTGSLDPARWAVQDLADQLWLQERLRGSLHLHEAAMERARDLGAAEADSEGNPLRPKDTVDSLAVRQFAAGQQDALQGLTRRDVDNALQALDRMRHAFLRARERLPQ